MITVLPADDPKKMRLGWFHWECFGNFGDYGGRWLYPKEMPPDLVDHIGGCDSCKKIYQRLIATRTS
jgi:hypothetical protein